MRWGREGQGAVDVHLMTEDAPVEIFVLPGVVFLRPSGDRLQDQAALRLGRAAANMIGVGPAFDGGEREAPAESAVVARR